MISRARVLVLTALAALAGAAATAAPASAAPCAGNLTVAGLKVTGSDCVVAGNGSIQITDPRFGNTATVRINGKMVLNQQRTEMIQENVAVPLSVQVGQAPVVLGTLRVGRFELCDIVEPRSDAQILSGHTPLEPGLSDFTDVGDLIPNEAGCRQVASIRVDSSSIRLAAKLVGLDLDALKRPLVLGIDDERGGRVFGTLGLLLPEPLKKALNVQRIAFGAEVSAANGFRPTGLGIAAQTLKLPLPVPGAFLRRLNLFFDVPSERFSGGALIVHEPSLWGLGGSLTLERGALKQLGAQVQFAPAFPIVPGINVNTVGAEFRAASSNSTPGGKSVRTPASLTGSLGFFAGPPVAGAQPLGGDVALTVAGPRFTLRGQVFALNRKIKLADARILTSFSPFRFEAEANVSVLKIIDGRVFVGLTSKAFTGLGTVSIKVPENIPLIGGQRLGGFDAAVSNVGAGGLITIDLPLLRPKSIGVGVKYSPFKASLISSLDRFITVRPSAAQLAGASSSGEPVALAAAQRRLRIGGLAEVVVAVTGARRAPRKVRFITAGGKRVRAAKLSLGASGKTVYFGVPNPPRSLTVRSPDRIARLAALRDKEFPYLDPSPGYGSRPRGPVQAGQPARVCWKVKHAPRGAVVDLFEDQNGALGTGRDLATGLKPRGCFDVPTAGLEPGKHWVYGVLRVGEQAVSTRYWPIPLEIFDPTALPAPSGVGVQATPDGALVGFDQIFGAASYQVLAEPAVPGEAEPVEYEVAANERFTHLNLRGARRWKVQVRGIGFDGRYGNLSPEQEVAPTDPVVLSGEPNGVAQVGKPWAFKLDTDPGTSLRLLSAPRGLRIARGGLLTWRPSRKAGNGAPQALVVQACKGDRCVEREFQLSAYRRNLYPFGPARGFAVTPNVLRRRGGTITIRAQGIDQRPVVRIDGRRLKRVRRIDATTVEARTGRLRRGPHSVSLRIGKDAAEVKRGAIVVR